VSLDYPDDEEGNDNYGVEGGKEYFTDGADPSIDATIVGNSSNGSGLDRLEERLSFGSPHQRPRYPTTKSYYNIDYILTLLPYAIYYWIPNVDGQFGRVGPTRCPRAHGGVAAANSIV
jgi:hypothetical protein